MARKLRCRGFPREAVEQVLEDLVRGDQLSDRRFAESLTRRRAEQGYGPRRIRMELQRLGVEDWDAGFPDYDWDAVLERIHRKKFGSISLASSRDVAIRTRFLLQRGFDPDQIRRLLRRQLESSERHSV